MKTLISIIAILFSFIQLNAQDLKDSRVVYCTLVSYLDTEMLDTWDSGTLTSNETKKYLEFQKRLKSRILDRVIEKSNAFLTENGAQVQPLETAGQFGMMATSAEGYPAILFPKKTLKKKGEKLDLGDYFIGYFVSFDKGGAKPSLKGYSPAFEVEVKLFTKNGEKIKSFKTKSASEKVVGVVSMKAKKDYFSRTDFDSIDYVMDSYGAALDKATDEALQQLIQ